MNQSPRTPGASSSKKIKEADLYIAFIEVSYTQGAQVRITQCYLQTTPYLPLVVRQQKNFMTHFKAKNAPNPISDGPSPHTLLGSLQHSCTSPSWIWGPFCTWEGLRWRRAAKGGREMEEERSRRERKGGLPSYYWTRAPQSLATQLTSLNSVNHYASILLLQALFDIMLIHALHWQQTFCLTHLWQSLKIILIAFIYLKCAVVF